MAPYCEGNVPQSSCPSGNEEPTLEPLEPDHELEEDAGAGGELEVAAQNWAPDKLELVAVDDQLVVEEDEDVDVEVDVGVDVHVEVGVVEDEEQTFAGAVPSAHFKSPSAIPVHTSSGEIRFPSSSKAVTVGPGNFSVTVQSRRTW
jgi:hypothetical protein